MAMNRIPGAFAAAFAALVLAACGAKPAPTTPTPARKAAGAGAVDPAVAQAALLAAEQDAYHQAQPVFAQFCAGCHTDGGAHATPETIGHFDMNRYPFGGHHATVIGPEVRAALGLAEDPASMPKDRPGAVQGDDLARIDRWAQAWTAADDGGAHGPKVAPPPDDDDAH
jgi:cytochrome c5